MVAVGMMQNANLLPLNEALSLSAADLSLRHRLAMADAVVYASALQENAVLVTSGKDLKGWPQVRYFPKKD